jgi:general stress protein 26
MTRAQLVRLLREHRLAVVSTIGPDGGPQSAVVGCAIGDDLEIVFDTLDSTRKAHNLRRDARISVVIGWDRKVDRLP